jgi:DNA invertase Pin-like site-specific DNA recombinase
MEERNKVAIYTRVSTDDQAKVGFSLDAQLNKLKSYCHARDWDVFDIYVDDGYSGRNVKRPAYTKLLDEIDQWDVLLVLKMDRIHRNSKNFMMMMEDLKKKDKEFVSMMESLDTSTAMGRFVMDIIQRIAQLESEQIGERVYIGMDQKASSNRGYLGFNIPFGYNYKNNHLIVNKEESKIVQKIYSMYLDGKSLGYISNWLNNNKIKTKRGGIWAKKTISGILKNPLYCGFIKWEHHINKNNHETIISIDEFNKVQNFFKNHGGIPAQKLKNR